MNATEKSLYVQHQAARRKRLPVPANCRPTGGEEAEPNKQQQKRKSWITLYFCGGGLYKCQLFLRLH